MEGRSSAHFSLPGWYEVWFLVYEAAVATLPDADGAPTIEGHWHSNDN
jgi:hypothetical protein